MCYLHPNNACHADDPFTCGHNNGPTTHGQASAVNFAADICACSHQRLLSRPACNSRSCTYFPFLPALLMSVALACAGRCLTGAGISLCSTYVAPHAGCTCRHAAALTWAAPCLVVLLGFCWDNNKGRKIGVFPLCGCWCWVVGFVDWCCLRAERMTEKGLYAWIVLF